MDVFLTVMTSQLCTQYSHLLQNAHNNTQPAVLSGNYCVPQMCNCRSTVAEHFSYNLRAILHVPLACLQGLHCTSIAGRQQSNVRFASRSGNSLAVRTTGLLRVAFLLSNIACTGCKSNSAQVGTQCTYA